MEADGAEEADGAAMDPASKKDYDNHPSGAGVVLYNQHMNAAEPSEGQEGPGEEAVQSPQDAAHTTLEQAEHAAQQSHPGTQSQQDTQDEQQVEQVEQVEPPQQQQPPSPPPQEQQPQPDLQPPATQLRQAPQLPQPPQPPQPQPQPQLHSGPAASPALFASVPATTAEALRRTAPATTARDARGGGEHKGAAAALMPGLGRADEGDGGAGPAAAAGVIFGCTNSTYEECFRLSMVGLPRKYLPLVESIVAGHTLIFLFNFSDRQLHGVYIATSAGQENLSLSAWKGLAGVPKAGRKDEHAQPSGIELEEQADDPDGSPFPAQCRGMVALPSWWCHSSLPQPPGANSPGS